MNVDWTQIYSQFKGQWVALKEDEVTVVAHGQNASKVWREAQAITPKPILMQVPTDTIAYVG